jgi:hypothetical protein
MQPSCEVNEQSPPSLCLSGNLGTGGDGQKPE